MKNHFWNSVGQLFNENEKLISGQNEITGVRTFGVKRCYVDVDKLIVWKGLSDHQRENLRLLRLCALLGKNGRWSYCYLEEQNKMVFGKQALKGYESNRRVCRRSSSGKYSQESQRLGLFDQIQTLMRDLQCELEHFKDRIIFMSLYNDIAWGEEGIHKDVNTIHRQLRIILANSLAVIGLSWGLDQKRNGTEPTLTNPVDRGTKQQRTWWWISQNPVTRYFVPPVPLKEES